MLTFNEGRSKPAGLGNANESRYLSQIRPPNVVQIEDVQKPVPKDDEVLVKVRAASANPLDWKVMSGGPYIIRTLLGLGKPKIRRPGADVAGRVESVRRKF